MQEKEKQKKRNNIVIKGLEKKEKSIEVEKIKYRFIYTFADSV